jgi:hypothetical protein
MEAKELAFKKEALEHGLAHIAIQNKDAMVELMLNIDETWRARSEKSWFETELDKVDNGWGKAGTKLGHDSITDHVVVKGASFDEKLPENFDMYPKVLQDMVVNPVERWKPEIAEDYWYVTIDGGPKITTYNNDIVDKGLSAFGNVFRTESDAVAARERVKKALLGE